MDAKKEIIDIPVPTGQHNQSLILDEVLGGIRDGFFIEAGAWDGRRYSNSMFFEWKRDWTGLLVEPNKEAFRILVTRGYRKRSVAVHGCLSPANHSQEMLFHPASVYGSLVNDAHLPEHMQARMLRKSTTLKNYPVICYPLYSLLLALGNPVVDFFSLDVEGAELPILRTIPFQKVTIRVFLVEVAYSDEKALIQFMDSVGYKVLQKLTLDLLFVPK